MTYAVYTIKGFDEKLNKLSFSDKEIIQKIFLQLKGNPYVGDAIRYRFFREKRIREKRIYYLIYECLGIVLVVGLGGKKDQQDTINKIISLFPEYNKYAKILFDS